VSGKSKRVIGQLVPCTKCGIEKPWGIEFFKTEGGKPRNPCVECDNKKRAAYTKAHPDQERQRGRERMARWRANNPEKNRALQERSKLKPKTVNRELARLRENRWKRNNPKKRVVEAQRRQAMKRNLPNSFKALDWEKALSYWNNRCCICGRVSGNGFVLAIEHWIPLSDKRADNPGTVPANILPMCHARSGSTGGCNNSKWIREPVSWLKSYLGNDLAEIKLAEILKYFSLVQGVSISEMEVT
jgi:hypothetical protein